MRGNYGVDAPGVILGMLAAAVAMISGGVFVAITWPIGLIDDFAVVVALWGLIPLVLGLGMVSYGFYGKFRLRDWMLGLHDWQGEERVLDVGAGRGLMAVGAAKRVPRGTVVAIDIWNAKDLSGNGEAGLLANADAEHVRHLIDVRSVDARAVGLPDESVDVIFSVLCLHNIEPASERAKALSEIARVLKPGGRAYIGDYTGTPAYALHFRQSGLTVRGPINAILRSLGLMWVIIVEK